MLAITHKPAFLIGKREWIVVYPDMEPMLNMCSNPDHQHVVPPSEKPWFFLTMSGAEDAGNGLVAIKVIKFENIDGETIGDSNLLYTGNGTKIIAPSDKTFMVLLTGFTTFGGMN